MNASQKKLLSISRSVAIYVDKKIVVINKPPGMVSQANSEHDLQEVDNDPVQQTADWPYTQPEDVLSRALDEITTNFGLLSRPVPVHRLDKPTTGALLLALTSQAARDLSQQFAARSIRKTYLALVRGGRKTFAANTGEIDAALKIDDGRVSLSPGGKEAHTSWELVESSSTVPLSLLRLTLHTGLKHQLRVHLAHALKAPILGDSLYSRSEASEKIRSLVSFPPNRLFLHASHISFLRYRAWGQSKQFRLGITAPLPKDFVEVCTQAGFALDAFAIRGGVTIDGQPAPPDLSSIRGQWIDS